MTAPVTQAKRKQPCAKFPLTAHSWGQWIKKIGGKRRYFVKWDDLDAALAEFQRQFPYLAIGIEPSKNSLTLAEVLDHCDDFKNADVDAGRIA